MALRFRYPSVPVSTTTVASGGRSHRNRPLVPIRIFGPAGDIFRDALIDTGSDEIVIGDHEAILLGVDLTNAPSGTFGGVGSPPMTVRFAWVTLRLTDGIEFREWDALVGFAPLRLRRVIFGIAHGLEYFTATFHGDRRELELVPNAAYPGT